MMKNNRRCLYLAAGICALLCAVCAFLLPVIAQRIRTLEADMAAVDAFLQRPLGTPFTNQAALDAFSRPAPTGSEEGALYVYTSPEGIEFVSQSAAWDETGLERLYEELLLNQHGEELYSLSKVIVYPQEDDDALATHEQTSERDAFRLRFPALPPDFEISFQRDTGVISLYGGDRNTTAESMADSLSHEYGHHYTFYHMFPGFTREQQYLDSEYFRLRGLDPETVEVFSQNDDFYNENHHRFLFEIAAEDYVVLMGSPNSRAVGNYCDVQDSLYDITGEEEVLRNCIVQENLMLPMPYEQEGLAEYFYSFIGRQPPQTGPTRDMEIEIQRYSVGYDLVGGDKTFTSHTLTWNKAYGDDAIYTLVTYDADDYANTIVPIKTVYPGDPARAYIGNVVLDRGSSVTYCDDGLNEGTRTFVVTAVLPDGSMYKSEPFDYTFQEGV